MPDTLPGKIIITNTTTPEDRARFCKAGVKYLVTTTPVIEGRSFGTNLMEAAMVALMGRKDPVELYQTRQLLSDDIDHMIDLLGYGTPNSGVVNLDAIITAGGITLENEPLYPLSGGGYKALLEIMVNQWCSGCWMPSAPASVSSGWSWWGCRWIPAHCRQPLTLMEDHGDAVENM
jgi:hypothetical protein